MSVSVSVEFLVECLPKHLPVGKRSAISLTLTLTLTADTGTDTGNSLQPHVPEGLVDVAEMLFQRTKLIQLGGRD